MSQLAVLDRVRADLPKMHRAPTEQLAQAYYSLARLAYDGDVDGIGRHAEKLARELGLPEPEPVAQPIRFMPRRSGTHRSA